MLSFITQRLCESLVVLLIMSFITYGLMGLMPGDPIDLMIQANPGLGPNDAFRLKAIYGLDQPIIARYSAWLSDALSGDFGFSRLYNQPVFDILWPRLLDTLKLMIPAFLIAVAISIPLGIMAALKPYSIIDYTINLVSFSGISIPSFWLALLAIIYFSINLGWFPASGNAEVGASFWDSLRYMVLPICVLVVTSIGSFIRFMRAAMIETLRQDYVRTARAKGVSEYRLLTHHCLQNALIPLITVIALSFGSLFSGTLIIETIFSWPGMGKMIYDSILGNDYNLAMVGFLLATVMTIAGNLLADIGYAIADPRVQLSKQNDEGATDYE